MPKLIVTSRYLKSGSGKKKQLYHYVKYIATREGSVPIPNANETAPATKSQQELISSLLHDFPDSKELFEYEDYQKNPTIKNGSALISVILDRNMDRLTSRENYVGYLANRPGTVKFGSHGLFSQSDEPINLEKVAKDIANHGGNVWTHVVSLRRDNAQAMGYDNLKAWRELVKRQIPNIAKNQKIDMANLKWYAAFHDKKTNPHVHIIVYSDNEREGFLTNHGIEKIRSGFANDIYADELHNLYAQQTDLRNLMKKESEQLMQKLADNISQNDVDNAELIDLVAKLHEQLNSSKGKKVYGYLKADVKKTVDEIFIRLSENESIQKMYSLWCEMEQQKHDVYSSAKLQFPKLADNKEFKSVKNMIIRTVLDMNSPVVDIEIEEPELTEKTDDDITDIPPQIDESKQLENDNVIFSDNEELTAEEFTCSNESAVTVDIDDEPQSKYYLKWSTAYKEACKIIYNKQSKLEDFQKAEQLLLNESRSGNVLAIQDLGKLYSTDKLGEKDEKKSFSFYEEAFQGFMEIEPDSDFMFPYEPKFDGQIMKPVNMRSYVWYRIGKMHCYGLGTEQDYAQSFEWFLKSAHEGNKFAQYSLANLYTTATVWKKTCLRRFGGIANHLNRVSLMLPMPLRKCTARVNMLLRIKKPHRDITRSHYPVFLNLKARVRRTIIYITNWVLCTKRDLERRLIFLKPSNILKNPLKICGQLISSAGFIFSVQRNLKKIRKRLWSGSQSPQMTEMSMLRICLTIWHSLKTLYLQIRSSLCSLISASVLKMTIHRSISRSDIQSTAD